jgi:hypothetical protein
MGVHITDCCEQVIGTSACNQGALGSILGLYNGYPISSFYDVCPLFCTSAWILPYNRFVIIFYIYCMTDCSFMSRTVIDSYVCR